MKPVIFISDLHLSPERPDIIQLFIRFLDEKQGNVQSLYILGDFVEYWLGDDDRAEGLTAVIDRLKQFSSQGHDVFLMHGNRDFLMGEDFAQRCGASLITDPCLLQMEKETVLLLHGDVLCTDDTDYQMFRTMVRNPEWQQAFLSKPLAEREQMAKAMREKSRQETRQKAEDIMDVNSDAIEQIFKQHTSTFMIHGHTHRPAVHKLEFDGRTATRVVLGDWYQKGSYLELNSLDDFKLKDFY